MLPDHIKKKVYERAKGLCEYCKSPADISTQPFAIEHIIAKSNGGGDETSNLALSCQGCNNHKYNKSEGYDGVTGKMVRLFHPRTDQWVTHFAWDHTTTEILGQSAIGRATIDALKLNRPGLTNLRRLLASVGKHPPTDQ